MQHSISPCSPNDWACRPGTLSRRFSESCIEPRDGGFRNGAWTRPSSFWKARRSVFQNLLPASATRRWLPSAGLFSRVTGFRRVNTGGRASNFRALFRNYARRVARLEGVSGGPRWWRSLLVQRKVGIAVKGGENLTVI